MEALSLLDKLHIDSAIKAALAAGFQADVERAQRQHEARALALETRIQHDQKIVIRKCEPVYYLPFPAPAPAIRGIHSYYRHGRRCSRWRHDQRTRAC